MCLTFLLSFDRIIVIGSKVIRTEYTRLTWTQNRFWFTRTRSIRTHEIKGSHYWQKSITIVSPLWLPRVFHPQGYEAGFLLSTIWAYQYFEPLYYLFLHWYLLMFPLQFLFDPVPVFHRVNDPSYWSIPKKLVVWFLYLVPVLSLVTSVCALCVSPHTVLIYAYLSYSTIWIGLSTNSPSCCVWIFISSPNNCPWPHHPHTCRPTISNVFYLLHQTPFSFFPYALVVLLVSVFVSGFLLVSLVVCCRFFSGCLPRVVWIMLWSLNLYWPWVSLFLFPVLLLYFLGSLYFSPGQ